jgi:hypothetical protein
MNTTVIMGSTCLHRISINYLEYVAISTSGGWDIA